MFKVFSPEVMHMKRVGVAVDCHLQPSAQHDIHWALLINWTVF